jgi:hypothetical protein
MSNIKKKKKKKGREISWPAEELLASQLGICSMQVK